MEARLDEAGVPATCWLLLIAIVTFGPRRYEHLLAVSYRADYAFQLPEGAGAGVYCLFVYPSRTIPKR